MTEQQHCPFVLGILGGLGPLASAEFLRTIYEYWSGEQEQTMPRVVLYSDPTFPDRTEALLRGSQTLLQSRLQHALEVLLDLNVSKIVICCVTIHAVLPALRPALREKAISLIDTIFTTLQQRQERQLLLCTTGTRTAQIFQTHPLWSTYQQLIIWPDDTDQQRVQDMIYQLKQHTEPEVLAPEVETLLHKYAASSFIAGCTELHLLTKRGRFAEGNAYGYRSIDPLITIAQTLAKE